MVVGEEVAVEGPGLVGAELLFALAQEVAQGLGASLKPDLDNLVHLTPPHLHDRFSVTAIDFA